MSKKPTTEKNRIAGNVVSQIIGRVIVLVMALITIKLISSYSGTEGMGYYNTIITYLSFFIAIADFGLFSIGVREIAKNPEKKQQLLNNIFTIRLISALVVTTVAVIIAQLTSYPPIIKHGVLIASFFLFFNLAGSVFDMIFQTRMTMKNVALAEVIAKVVSLIALSAVVFFKLDFLWIIATLSIAALASFTVKYILTAKEEMPNLGWDPAIIKEITYMALPFGMIFILNNFYFKVDTLILFYFKGASQVGIYAVAYRVLETTMFVAGYLAHSLKPLFSANIESDKQKTASATSSGIIFLLAISLAISVICIPNARDIIVFLSTDDFAGGAPLIIILAFASLFIYMNTLISEILIAKDARKYLLTMAISVLSFNVIANIILIPIFSFYAAAILTLISELLIFSLGLHKAKKIIPLKLDIGRIFKLLFAATVSIALAFILSASGLYFMLTIIISTGFYAWIVYLIDAVPKEMVKNYLISLKKNG